MKGTDMDTSNYEYAVELENISKIYQLMKMSK